MQYDQVTDSIRKLSIILHITGSGSILPIYWKATGLINNKVKSENTDSMPRRRNFLKCQISEIQNIFNIYNNNYQLMYIKLTGSERTTFDCFNC